MIFDDKEFIAKKIRLFRKKAGLTQAKLAEKIGLSDKHVCRIENASYVPSLGTFLRILEVLQIDISEFGIKSRANVNPIRENVIKLIYGASDARLALYDKVLRTLEEELPKF